MNMSNKISFFGEPVPLEMHKVKIVQKLSLNPIEERQLVMNAAGNNTFLLKNENIFLDMLSDSGVNAMSDNQLAAMMQSDDSYAGSKSFTKLEETSKKIFKKDYIIPVHQGRAAENILARVFVKQGDIIPMNYHFTTTKAHILINGGTVVELFTPEAMKMSSADPFKGNMDTDALRKLLEKEKAKIPFVRMEAGTNLIGGQPFSLENLRQVKAICSEHNIPIVLDASLLSDNLYFIKVREEAQKDSSIEEITKQISDLCDIIYFSARKLGSARGGLMLTSNRKYYEQILELVPLFEGFITYGGMSVREIEAISVGLEETMDFDMIKHGPEFIEFMVKELEKRNIPVVTPAGGLGCHLNAKEFIPHLKPTEYPAGSLGAALFIAGSIRGMERGTLSEERNPDGSEHIAEVELLRLALPRRVFTMSQIKYAVDRIHWLYENRNLIGGLKWVSEPKILRFFVGRLEANSDWQEKLVKKFRADFGDSL